MTFTITLLYFSYAYDQQLQKTTVIKFIQ